MNFIRESIFSSAIRSFSAAFLGIIGGLLGIGVFFALFAFAFFPTPDTPPPRYHFINQPRVDGTLSNHLIAPTLLRINITTAIGVPTLNADLIDALLVQVDQQITPEYLKGILVYFDTPGGSAVDSYRIYLALNKLKKRYNIPVYGFVEGMCASGGVYISAACDKMFSSPPSILGSVGVRMGPFFNVSSFLKNHGVDAANISTKNKIHMDPFTPWKPNEEDFFKPILNAMYTQFVDAVVDGRCPEGMSKEMYRQKLLDVGAEIFASKDAVAYGFTNEPEATLNSALDALVKAANITDPNYRFVSAEYIVPFRLGGMQSILEKGSLTIEHKFFGDTQEPIKNDTVLAIYP